MNPPPSLPARLLARVGFVPRTDAAASPTMREDADLSGAGITNALSGLGGARDSGAMARPNLQREYLSPEELVALLRSSVYRRIVELKPRWATARGWSITDSTDEERPLVAALKRLGVQQRVREADVWARAFGESRILLVTDDPDELSEPLDPTRVRKLVRLEVLDKREFTPVRYNGHASVGVLGEPVTYRVHPCRPGVTVRTGEVHASRLLRFYGDELPPSERAYNFGGWGADAVGQTLWDGLRHLAQTGSGGAKIAQELSIAVFKLNPGQQTGDQRAALLSKMSAMNMMKSIMNAVILGKDEEFSRVAATPTGFADLSNHARLELALLTGYPLTLLFGIAPGGLSTDGESWKEAWWSEVAAYQEERYRSPIESIVELLYYSEQGGTPDEWSVEFAPLGELTEKEKAEIRLIHTQADTAAIMDGVLTVDEARSRYTQPGGFVVELQPVEERVEAAPVETDPAIEAEARKMVEAGLSAPAATEAPKIELTPSALAGIITVNEARASQGFAPLAGPDGNLTVTEYQAKHAATTAAAAAAEAGQVGPKVDADTYTVPAGAQGNARRVLRWREEHPDEIRGMTATGWARARKLADGGTISRADLIEIAAWFARHGAQGATKAVAAEFADEPWRDAGYVSWLGWGGDTMASYAEKARAAMERTDATEGACWIGLPLPESTRAAWLAARAVVETATGPLQDPGDDPHVTVLYMGQVAPEALPEVEAAVREVAALYGPTELCAETVTVFPLNKDGTPVVLGVRRAWTVESLQAQLLARLAHLVRQRQHVPYRPHVTLGYGPELTGAQQASAMEAAIPELEWTAARLEVRHGSATVAVVPLSGRVDSREEGT